MKKVVRFPLISTIIAIAIVLAIQERHPRTEYTEYLWPVVLAAMAVAGLVEFVLSRFRKSRATTEPSPASPPVSPGPKDA